MKRLILWSMLALLPSMAMAEDQPGLEELRSLAVTGDAEAMLELGILYEYGFRMPNNKPPALAWYRLAAENGSAKASSRHELLKSGMSGSELEESSRLYAEYAAMRKSGVVPAPAPVSTPVSAPAPVASTPAPEKAKKEAAQEVVVEPLTSPAPESAETQYTN
jgi:TPR repeat protein